MRINIYAEELSDDIEVITKITPDGEFTGLRMYMYLPVTLPNGEQVRGKFMHSHADDDSAAVTFWSRRDLRGILIKALHALDKDHREKNPTSTDGIKNSIEKSMQIDYSKHASSYKNK